MILEVNKTYGHPCKLKCDNCGILFNRAFSLLKNNKKHYCSKECRKTGSIVKCAQCGKDIYRRPNELLRRVENSFCSKKCCGQYQKLSPEKIKENRKEWYKNNREREIKRTAQWRIDNPEKRILQWKKEYANNRKEVIKRARQWDINHPEEAQKRKSDWFQDNKSELVKNQLERRRNNPKLRLNHRISGAIRLSLKSGKNGRHWENLIGYNLKDLMAHLKSLFKKDMSWENYGKGGWEIDHKKPISSFNFNSYEDEEFKQCWALDNLQPLWASDNRSKGNRII